jgi:hypothetical protein
MVADGPAGRQADGRAENNGRELTATEARPIRMIDKRQIRGLMAVGVLAVAVGGCGTAVATAGTGTAGTGAGTSGAGTAGGASNAGTTSATGCSSVTLATKVTVIRAMHLIEPQRAAALERTQTNPAKVQALFRDFCQILAHKDTSTAILNCPDQIGLSYGGAFYDGSRLLADYTYAASGCQRITLSGPGASPQSVVIWGTAAAAAPHLETDMDKVVGLPQTEVYQPFGTHIQKEGGATS